MDSYVIKLHIRNETELYHPFDPERLLLSNETLGYLRAKYQERKMLEKLTVEIDSDGPVDRGRVEAAFGALVASEEAILQKKRRTDGVKQLWMFLIGAAFLAAGLVLPSAVPPLVSTIISTIGAFSMWEAARIWIVEIPANRRRKLWLRTLAKTEIAIDDPVSRNEGIRSSEGEAAR